MYLNWNTTPTIEVGFQACHASFQGSLLEKRALEQGYPDLFFYYKP